MACPYLSSYRSTERGVPPTAPSGENVCFAAGSAYWPYGPVQLSVQRSLCLKEKDHKACPLYRNGMNYGKALPTGMPPHVAIHASHHSWWHFWK